MTAPFTAQLRARPETIVLGASDATPRWTVRVEMPEVWDVVRFSAPPSEPLIALKVRALDALYPDAVYHEDFVMKLSGVVVADENATLADTGAANGSIFLLQFRRRRPVR